MFLFILNSNVFNFNPLVPSGHKYGTVSQNSLFNFYSMLNPHYTDIPTNL